MKAHLSDKMITQYEGGEKGVRYELVLTTEETPSIVKTLSESHTTAGGSPIKGEDTTELESETRTLLGMASASEAEWLSNQGAEFAGVDAHRGQLSMTTGPTGGKERWEVAARFILDSEANGSTRDPEDNESGFAECWGCGDDILADDDYIRGTDSGVYCSVVCYNREVAQ